MFVKWKNEFRYEPVKMLPISFRADSSIASRVCVVPCGLPIKSSTRKNAFFFGMRNRILPGALP